MTPTPTLPAYLPHHIAVEVDRIITRSRPPFTFKTRLLNSTAGEPLKYAAQKAYEAAALDRNRNPMMSRPPVSSMTRSTGE